MPRLAQGRPTVRRLAPLLALALGGCAIHYPYYPLPQIPNDDADLGSRLGWLEGSWFRQDGALESELHFTTARGGTLLGTSRTVALHGLEGAGGSDGGVRTVEHALLLIEHTEGGVVYRSWPKGKDAASLRLVAARVKSAVFEDTSGPEPRHVSYFVREAAAGGGSELCVRNEGGGAPASERCYVRAAPIVE